MHQPNSVLLLAGLVAAIAACRPKRPTTEMDRAETKAPNVMHISWGGIAYPDPTEASRHWSTWTINLIDGSAGYGWTSDSSVAAPPELLFETAGLVQVIAITLDTRFAPIEREDGLPSQSPDGSPVRRFTVLGSSGGRDGPFTTLAAGEAKSDDRTRVSLPAPVPTRWLKLVIETNWRGGGQTRLSEFEVHGTLDQRGAAGPADVTGHYSHEYGPILLRQLGTDVLGCYNDGLGTLRGTRFGRIMRLAWFSATEGSIGAATLVAADGRLYGFWYRPEDRMGSPWNAVRTGDLGSAAVGRCAEPLGLISR